MLAGLIDAGRRLSGTELAHLQVRRAAITGGLNKLLASIDLLLMPVMPQAVWSLQGLAAAGRDADTVAARLRFTAPFDMSGHPTLTLPGGMTRGRHAGRLPDRRQRLRRGGQSSPPATPTSKRPIGI